MAPTVMVTTTLSTIASYLLILVLCLDGQASLSQFDDYSDEQLAEIEAHLNLNLHPYMQVRFFRAYMDHFPTGSTIDPLEFLYNSGLTPSRMSPLEVRVAFASAMLDGPGPAFDRTRPVLLSDGLLPLFTTRSFPREPWNVDDVSGDRTVPYDVILRSLIQEIETKARSTRRTVPYGGRQRAKIRAKFALTVYSEFLKRLQPAGRRMLGFDPQSLHPIYPNVLGGLPDRRTTQSNMTTRGGPSSTPPTGGHAQDESTRVGASTEAPRPSSSESRILLKHQFVIGQTQTLLALMAVVLSVAGALYIWNCSTSRLFNSTSSKTGELNYLSVPIKLE